DTRVQGRLPGVLGQPDTTLVSVGSHPARCQLVELREPLDVVLLEIEERVKVERPGLRQRWRVLLQVLPGPSVVVALDDTHRAGVDLPQRLQEVLLPHLRVLEDAALELGPGVLGPPGRLGVIHEVTDVDDLIRLVLADEIDDSLHRLPVVQRDLRVRDDDDPLAHTNLSNSAIRTAPISRIPIVRVATSAFLSIATRHLPVRVPEHRQGDDRVDSPVQVGVVDRFVLGVVQPTVRPQRTQTSLLLSNVEVHRIDRLNTDRVRGVPEVRERVAVERVVLPLPPVGLHDVDQDVLERVGRVQLNPLDLPAAVNKLQLVRPVQVADVVRELDVVRPRGAVGVDRPDHPLTALGDLVHPPGSPNPVPYLELEIRHSEPPPTARSGTAT